MFDRLLVQQMTNDLQWCTWMEACNLKIFIDHQLLYLGSHALQIKDFMDVLLSVLFKIDWRIDGKIWLFDLSIKNFNPNLPSRIQTLEYREDCEMKRSFAWTQEAESLCVQ